MCPRCYVSHHESMASRCHGHKNAWAQAPMADIPRVNFMEDKKTGIVIGIGNQKGGVGKTTNTVHLAAAFGERGYRVLVIDADPTAGATKHLGIPQTSFGGTFELLTRPDSDPVSLAVEEGMPKNVSVIPSRTELS